MGFFRTVAILTLIISSVSCSEFRKIQKSDGWEGKYEAALKYYEDEDYYRAIALFEEVIPLIKGKEEGEKAEFYYAYSHYYDKLYLLSSHYFKSFYETYSRSDFALESQYMYAYSLYKDSPVFNLDQASTKEAINAMQAFINKYSDSEFASNATEIIDELQVKLETKAYFNVKQYYKLSVFKSALIAFDNFSKDYPDSEYNEELQFLDVEVRHKLAEQSISSVQDERYREVITAYEEFIDAYPESSYAREAERLFINSRDQLARFKKQENQLNN